MVRASTLNGAQAPRNTRGARRQTPEQITADIQNHIEQLEREHPQQPAIIKLPIAKPNKFAGDYIGQPVICWLAELNTVFDAQEYNGTPLRDQGKLIIAASYLARTPHAQNDSYIEQNGQFATCDAFKTWIKECYSPSDYVLQYRQEYERLCQRNEESIDAYRLRFQQLTCMPSRYGLTLCAFSKQ